MSREIIVPPVGNPFELAESERKVVFEIVCLLRIEGAFLVGNIVNADLCAGDGDILIKPEALLQPIVGQSQSFLPAAKIFDLHLFEFAGAKRVVAWVNLVAEGLPNLRNAEGKLLTRSFQDVLELHEDRLGGLRPQIYQILVAFEWAREAFEHQVECPWFGQIPTPAIWTIFHAILERQLVCTMARLARTAVHHWIAKS